MKAKYPIRAIIQLSVVWILILISLCGCTMKVEQHTPDIDETAESVINSLKQPVTLVGITHSGTFDTYGITVKSGDGKLVTFGDLTGIANTIGSTRKIGDTLR